MKVSKLASPVENFTIAFDQSGGACTLQLGLGDHAGVGADHGEEVAEIYC